MPLHLQRLAMGLHNVVGGIPWKRGMVLDGGTVVLRLRDAPKKGGGILTWLDAHSGGEKPRVFKADPNRSFLDLTSSANVGPLMDWLLTYEVPFAVSHSGTVTLYYNGCPRFVPVEHPYALEANTSAALAKAILIASDTEIP